MKLFSRICVINSTHAMDDIALSIKNENLFEIKEFIKNDGNIYKELKRKAYDLIPETLMSWACRKQQVEIIESLLEIYERDYKLAERSVLNKENKKFLLRYIFLALTENEIEEVEKISMNLAEDCKKVLVLFGDRATSVLIPIQGQENLLLRLYKNGLININSRDFNKENIGHHVGLMNRVDILKRMISIGLNIFNDSKTIGNCITSSSCLGLLFI